MHIPDGFLSARVLAATGVVSVAGVGLALRRARRVLPPSRVPLMGLAAAFIFVAQMLNFPVAGGTSGHLLGGVLAAALLGPAPAVVVMTSVLILQCFLFSDGGVLSLGANILNMALVGTLGGFAVDRWSCGLLAGFSATAGLRGRVAAMAFAGWASTLMASMACAAELACSGMATWRVVFPAMVGVHLLIGIGEGVITAMVGVAVARARPELFRGGAVVSSFSRRRFVAAGFGVTALLALVAAPLASTWPDGLEKVAQRLGFEHAAVPGSLAAAPLSKYVFSGVGAGAAATALAGMGGATLMFALALLLARALVPRVKGGPLEGGKA